MSEQEHLARLLAADYCLLFCEIYLCCEYRVIARMDPMQFSYADYFAKYDKIADVTIYKALANFYVTDMQLFIDRDALFYFSNNKKYIFIYED